jgi:hypothetical protein
MKYCSENLIKVNQIVSRGLTTEYFPLVQIFVSLYPGSHAHIRASKSLNFLSIPGEYYSKLSNKTPRADLTLLTSFIGIHFF